MYAHDAQWMECMLYRGPAQWICAWAGGCVVKYRLLLCNAFENVSICLPAMCACLGWHVSCRLMVLLFLGVASLPFVCVLAWRGVQ